MPPVSEFFVKIAIIFLLSSMVQHSGASDAAISCLALVVKHSGTGSFSLIQSECLLCKHLREEPDNGACIQGSVGWCWNQPARCTNDSLGCKEIKAIASDCANRQPPPPGDPDKDPTGVTEGCPAWMIGDPIAKTCECKINGVGKGGAVPASSAYLMKKHECESRFGGNTAPAAKSLDLVPPQKKQPADSGATPVGKNQECQTKLGEAQTCCGNPATCVRMPNQTRNSGESIPAWCARIRNELTNGANNVAAAACSQKITACKNACKADGASCDALESQVGTLGRQSIASSVNSEYAQQCNQNSQSQPQSSSPASSPGGASPSAGPSDGSGGSPAEQAAQKAIDAINNTARGQSEFKETVAEREANGFNVADNVGGSNPQASSGDFAAGAGSPLDKIKGGSQQGTVANNSGGQIPGSGGDSGGAKLGGGRGGGSPGAPGYTTDVLQGFQNGGGGGAAAPGGGSTDTNGNSGEGFSGYGSNRGPTNVGDGLDLKKYLPGGKLDPGSKFGGFKPFSIEINGRHVNLWNKISDRFQEKCRLGELIDCR